MTDEAGQDRLDAALATVAARIDALHQGQGADEHGTIMPADEEAHEAAILLFLAGIPDGRAVAGWIASEARRMVEKVDNGVPLEYAAFGLLQIACLVGSLMGNDAERTKT